MVVIDSSVKYDTNRATCGNHRLVSCLSQVEYRETAMAEHSPVPDLNSLIIRSAACKGRNHLSYHTFRQAAVSDPHYTGNSTHLLIPHARSGGQDESGSRW